MNQQTDESKTYCATIYMKSGNVIQMPNLESFTAHKNGLGQLSQIEWIISPNTVDRYRVLSIDIDQVEAIIVDEES